MAFSCWLLAQASSRGAQGHRHFTRHWSIVLGISLSVTVLAPYHARAQSDQSTAPPLVNLGSRVAVSPETFATGAQVLLLSDGRVMVNDVNARRLGVLNDKLEAHVALDSGATTAHAYGRFPGQLSAFRGDSGLFYIASSQTLLVLDPEGNIARAIALPSRFSKATAIEYSSVFGLVLTIQEPSNGLCHSSLAEHAPIATVVVCPDSLLVMSVRLGGMVADTVARLATSSDAVRTAGGGGGGVELRKRSVPFVDALVIHPDGKIGILSARTYQLKTISPDRSVAASPPARFNWRPIDQPTRERILDSVLDVRMRVYNAARTRDSLARIANPALRPIPRIAPVRGEPDEIPPAYPPFVTRPLVDGHGQLWVLRNQTIIELLSGLVYDVVAPDGRIVRSVQLPPLHSLVAVAADFAYVRYERTLEKYALR